MNHGWPWHQASCTLNPVLADALRALQTALGEPTTQETSYDMGKTSRLQHALWL